MASIESAVIRVVVDVSGEPYTNVEHEAEMAMMRD